MATKMSININDEARELLEKLIEEKGGSFTSHTHRGFSLLKFFDDAQQKGDEIFIRRANGSEERVLFLW